MLTIKNYFKLCQQSVGTQGWVISFADETKDYYEIKLVHNVHPSMKVRLQRKKTQAGGKVVYRFTHPNGTPTNQCVTADYIEDINNFLKALSNLLP